MLINQINTVKGSKFKQQRTNQIEYLNLSMQSFKFSVTNIKMTVAATPVL